MMHKSKISIQKWFMLIHLMTSIKKSMSALEVSRQLDIRYDTIFHAMQKIRCLMGKRDSQYHLSGTIEMDDAFFVAVDLLRDENEVQKRGCGSQRTAKVLVMVESEYTGATEEKVRQHGKASDHKNNRRMGYAKMIVVDDLSADTINYEVRKHMKASANVISDKWCGYAQVDTIIN